ncbi:nuclear pore complex protein Nup153 [Harpegnathos saltator]|uniref:Nuclear pore complex protein Nup153 n=1 Tax=Harpegnathos saltator TaxID=610380 RepID=E2BF18_HARSA|nr:nuclear pore complex protein Nup153 [Harpegnathos saltator]EFN85696.1 Nuclear pore complex protein Nup153 [Harpegnathos saltator]
MAKGSGNPAGKQPPSRNAKPYDANNSFVKKVATKVTDFIPQRSWISKWFNTSQGSEETLDVRENPEESEFIDDAQQPPPSKRPRIRMDVTHPPGTFSIQPRGKTALNTVDSSKKQYSIQNETPEDFLEPATAGPSGIGRLVTSTPAIPADIRTVTSHRSDLNSLASSTNNGTANGLDDHSESSESTSGCSSLTPQTNRHEGPSNLLQQIYNSSFTNRKRHIDDKLTFTNHLQSPRSLFLDNNSRDTLSSRRPSFNASVMTNLIGRASPLSSPFYSGNTTFGGSNTAGLYKRGRNTFNDSSELQLKVPRRTSVEVKPSNTVEVDSSGMSQTAKKILEALEHFSSPISDAKKIPVRNADSSPLMSRKRAREEVATPSARVGLRHLTRELTVPTVPDILKLRRRQKLQDTTLAARKIVSARTDPPPPTQEYHLRTEDSDREKYHGKIKGKSKKNLEEEETVEPVNLPNIPLPISTLPNFTFTLPPPPHTITKTTTNKENTFTFASPIKVTDAGKNLQSSNHYTFSDPINAEDNASNVTLYSSSSSVTGFTGSPDHTVTSMPNFIWSSSSTAPRLKEKTKNNKDIVESAHEMKSGSVMDILCPKLNQAESNVIAQSNVGLSSKAAHTDKMTSAFDSNTDVKSARDTDSSGSVSSIATPATNWECSECLIRNSDSDKHCIACKAARPNPNDKVSTPPSTTDIVVKTKPVTKDCFGSHFKLSTNEWECTACYVRNKQNDVTCVACTAAKPENKPMMQAAAPAAVKFQKSDLMEKFKPAEGSWECSGCLLRNNANVITCPCCNTSKPTPMKVSSTKTDAVESSAQKSTPVSTEGPPTEAGNSDLMNKFKPSKDSWECPGCFVRNNNSVSTCPCCSTAKPGSVGSSSKPEQTKQTSTTNGFGDKFKKPEGAWTCDSCMLQNDAKHTECVACQAAKPGTTKSNEPASSSGSTLQFKFGMPANSGGFKFGIDKTDGQSKSDAASPLNGFKFGNVQPSSGTAQFTFGIPKDESKATTSEATKTNSTVVTSSGSSGFQFNIKATEKSNTKTAQEIKQDSSFGMVKADVSMSSSNSEQQTASNVSSAVVSSALFTFGAQKSIFSQPALNKQTQKTSLATTAAESSKLTVTSDATAINVSTTLPTSLPKPSYTSPNDVKASPIFSFGVPSSTSAATSNTSTASTTTTCLPTFAQPSLTFSDSPKTTTPQAAAAVPTFGQATTTPSPALSANLTFGENKITEAAPVVPPPSSDKPAAAAAAPSAPPAVFPIVSSSTSLFSSNDSKAPTTFGQADKLTVFAGSTNKPAPSYSAPESKIPVFSGAVESKSIFDTQETKLPVFGSGEKTATPVFNSPGQAGTVLGNRFGSSTSSILSPFGSSSSPAFGANNTNTPAFGSTTTSAIFSTTKSNESNAAPTLPAIPAFGSSQPAAQQPASGGFNFSANTISLPESIAEQFVFGRVAPSSSSIFNNDTFANTVPTNTANFTFNALKQQETPSPAFGQTSVATPMFGSNPQTQATSSFSSTSSSSAGFNFGSTAPSATPSGGFNFGGMTSTSTPTGGFNFNPPASTPTVAFDPNSRPSFNFTKGSAPTAFNAPPQSATAPRKIKKAYRRIR